MQIIIPISGRSEFFPANEFFFPKPLVEVTGKPMIAKVIERLHYDFGDAKFIFIIDRDDACSFYLDRTLKLLSGEDSVVIVRPGATSGALCSCLLAVDSLDITAPLIVANSDQIITAGIQAALDVFRASHSAAGVLTFDSVHPRWSYIIEGENRHVLQAFEKHVASRNAIAGLYYFNSAEVFVNAAKNVILKDAHTNGLYFISSALNEVILDGGLVLHYPIANENYHSFYAPSKISEFERRERLAETIKYEGKPLINIIIPAAGEGSRFAKAGWKRPKPFINISGRPMIEYVIDNVTPKRRSAALTVMLREKHIAEDSQALSKLRKEGHHIIPVPELTEGTACTALLARKVFDNESPMVIANSDQIVEFDIDDYIDDCLIRGLDGSILVFTDSSKDPKWSFVRLDEKGYVLEVAEKKPISDLATVGIYLFAKGSNFIDAATDMILANDRVNGEFYTCPVYNYMIKAGLRIGVYEIPMEAMSGLGTPEDLNTYLDRNNYPMSSDSPVSDS